MSFIPPIMKVIARKLVVLQERMAICVAFMRMRMAVMSTEVGERGKRQNVHAGDYKQYDKDPRNQLLILHPRHLPPPFLGAWLQCSNE